MRGAVYSTSSKPRSLVARMISALRRETNVSAYAADLIEAKMTKRLVNARRKYALAL
jgi:hypothetical protein